YEKRDHCRDRDDEQQPQDGNAQVHLPVDAALVQVAENLLWLQREKEERRVVGHGGYVVGIIRGKRARVLAAYEPGERRMGQPRLFRSRGKIEHVQIEMRI